MHSKNNSGNAVASEAVAILTYHSLDNSGSVTSVAPDDFRQHMRILSQRGFTGISLSTLLDSWEKGSELPSRPVVITFDDGFANVLEHGAPVLSDLGFRATIFVVSGRCGQTNDWPQRSGTPRLPLLSWSALMEMAAAGFEIGSHSVTHRLPTEISKAEAEREIVDSKATIEDRLGRAVQSFAYPFGLVDRASYDFVRRHFRAACGTKLAKTKSTSDRFDLPRLDVYYLRNPLAFRLFETLPGEFYLTLRRIARGRGGRTLRSEMQHQRRGIRTISKPRGWPFIGHLPDFLADKLTFLNRCAKEHSGNVQLKLPGPTYLLLEPQDIGYVLETGNDNYTKSLRLVSRRGRWLSGHGLITSYGKAHLTQRRAMQPLFHQRAIASFADAIVNTTVGVADRWKNGAELEIVHEMMALAQRVIGFALFGVDLRGDANKLGEAIHIRRRYIQYWFGSLFPLPEYWPTKINREYRRAMNLINREIDRMVRERRQSEGAPRDLLEMLTRVSYTDGSLMSDEQVRDEAITLSITGFETIGVALAWTWYLLAKHPDVEAALFAEIKRECGDRPPNGDDFPRLRYTAMVLSEAMRLYPPTWLFVRVARRNDVLPSGTKIPRGAKLYLSQYVMHRNPRYFPDPERFDPLRFNEVAIKARPKYAYFPFGGGPHLCIGQGLALMEGVLAIATIVSRWSLSLAHDHAVEPEPGIILKPKKGIAMRCHLRSA